jgi:flagellar protein FliS
LLYEELTQALRVAAWAAERKQFATRSERVTRATAILFALEANLDFEKGGDVSRVLARFYAGCRRQVIDASVGTDGAPFRAVAAELEEIAGAWRQARAA